MAYLIYDEFEPYEIEEQERGDFIVSAEMHEDNWLIGYQLSFGANVEVMESVYLKEVLVEQAKLIYKNNNP